MTIRRIMATSGGFMTTDLWDVTKPGRTLLQALQLTGKARPKLCFIMTAGGDNSSYLTRSYAAMSETECSVTHLQLFTQPNAPIEERIMGSDVIWVGGGSVANLLAIWRLHGLDLVLRQAYEAGIILAGVSAGSLCWHQGGATDSFGPILQPVTNGLALLPFGNAVHFDSEPTRRPMAHQMVREGIFERIYATDDGIGILYENEIPVEVVADAITTETSVGPAAYLITKQGETINEQRLAPGRL